MNKPLVLVVEDDTPVRNLITTTLKTHEYRYLSSQNGASAVMEALSHNPDIVLLDLGLPDIDGVEIIDVYKRQNPKRLYRSWLILSNNFVRYKIKHSSGYFSENATGQSYSTQLRIQCQCLFPVSSRAGHISTSRFQLIFFSFFHCCRQSLYQKPDLLRSA